MQHRSHKFDGKSTGKIKWGNNTPFAVFLAELLSLSISCILLALRDDAEIHKFDVFP